MGSREALCVLLEERKKKKMKSKMKNEK